MHLRKHALCLTIVVLGVLIVVNSQTQIRILGGSPTSITRFPVMVQLLLDSWENDVYTQYCAGVILTVRHVITAGHCFQYSERSGKDYRLPNYWKIRVGSSYRGRGGTIIDVKQLVIHPHFEKDFYNNDIAVVTAATAFKLSSSVRQGTIPKQGSEAVGNSVCTIVGWGANKVGGPQAERLHSATLKIIDSNTCNNRYSVIGAKITDAMMCAGVLDQGTVDGCYGDSGGPLICKGLIVGLVSFGYACGDNFYPGVYTKISHFTDWIIQTVSTNI